MGSSTRDQPVVRQVEYRDFTSEAPSQTAFVCPGLTLRQIKRPANRPDLCPETVGTICPALRGAGGRENPAARPVWCGYNQVIRGGINWRRGAVEPPRQQAGGLGRSVFDIHEAGSVTSLLWKFAALPQAGAGGSQDSLDQVEELTNQLVRQM